MSEFTNRFIWGSNFRQLNNHSKWYLIDIELGSVILSWSNYVVNFVEWRQQSIEYLPGRLHTNLAYVCHESYSVCADYKKVAFNVSFIESWKSWNVKIGTRSSHRLLRDRAPWQRKWSLVIVNVCKMFAICQLCLLLQDSDQFGPFLHDIVYYSRDKFEWKILRVAWSLTL